MKHKEDFHLRFKYTPKMFANSVLWGLLVPIGVYYLVRSEQAPPRPLPGASAAPRSRRGPCASRAAAPVRPQVRNDRQNEYHRSDAGKTTGNAEAKRYLG